MIWQCRHRRFDLSDRVLVMGILNVTPDSFSDGGDFLDAEAAAARALEMAEQGADIIDIGGESSRPGAQPVGEEEERRRVVPVIERIRAQSEIPISIDTTKAWVARAALDAGANIVNDITALGSDSELAAVVAEFGAGIVLMHMQGKPRTMQRDPTYDDVVAEISQYLTERMEAAIQKGIQPECIALDPGIGFGKTLEHNLEIFRRMEEFAAIGRPILMGPSRKSFLRMLLLGEEYPPDWPVSEEIASGTSAAVATSVLRGASIVRVHDVAATAPLVKTIHAMR